VLLPEQGRLESAICSTGKREPLGGSFPFAANLWEKERSEACVLNAKKKYEFVHLRQKRQGRYGSDGTFYNLIAGLLWILFCDFGCVLVNALL